MINYLHLHMKTKDGGNMRRKVTMSISAHGQMLAGRLRMLIAKENKSGWFEYDGEGQRATGVAVRGRGGIVRADGVRAG